MLLERLLSTRSALPFLAGMLFGALFAPAAAFGQISNADEGTNRGTRPEISLNILDSSGNLIGTPATVRLYRSGTLVQQSSSNKGRVFFILDGLGEYSITVEASGFKEFQKDFSIRIPNRDEEYIRLVADSETGPSSVVPGKPLLAPKAKESLDKARQSIRDGKLDDAEKSAGAAAKLAPNNPDVLYVQGFIYLQRRDFPKAQSVLERATSIDPSNSRALSALGMALVNQTKYDSAIPPLEKSLQLEPDVWEAEWALAKAYYHHQQYDEAVKTSQKALADSHGGAPEIALLVAQSQSAVGQFEGAAKTLRQYIKDHPDDPGAATASRWLERLVADGKIRPS